MLGESVDIALLSAAQLRKSTTNALFRSEIRQLFLRKSPANAIHRATVRKLAIYLRKMVLQDQRSSAMIIAYLELCENPNQPKLSPTECRALK
jgi:hypothetical protein